MTPSSPSLVRRLALPLALSLLVHALAIGLPLLVPATGPAARTAVARPGSFSVRLALVDAPLEPSPGVTEDEWAPNDLRPEVEPSGAAAEVKVAVDPVRAPLAEPGNHEGRPGRGEGGSQAGPRGSTPGPRAGGLLSVPGTARRIVYLIDRSISMGPGGALDRARREVLSSLHDLPEGARFQIIAYNLVPQPLMVGGELVPAGPAAIEEAERRLTALGASGGTSHVRALKRALLLQPAPDLIFLVTDADEMTAADIRAITLLNRSRRAAIHVVELASAVADGSESLLAQLAGSNGGSHRRVRPAP